MEELKEAKEFIERQETTKKNNELNIEIYEKNLKNMKETFDIENEGDLIKKSGLTIIRANFEFEQSDAWKKWNEKSLEMGLRRRKENYENAVKQIQESIADLKEQNKRIVKSNSETTDRMASQKAKRHEYIG